MLDYRVFTFMKVCETLNFTQAAKAAPPKKERGLI